METKEILYTLVQDISNFSDILQALTHEDDRPEIHYCAGMAMMIRNNAIDYFLGPEEGLTLQAFDLTFVHTQYQKTKEHFLKNLSMRSRQFLDHIDEVKMAVSRNNQNIDRLIALTDNIRLSFISSSWILLEETMNKYFCQEDQS